MDDNRNFAGEPIVPEHWMIRAQEHRPFRLDLIRSALSWNEPWHDAAPVSATINFTAPVTTSVPWPESAYFSARLRLRLVGNVSISPLASAHLNAEAEDVLEELMEWIEERKAACLKWHLQIRPRWDLPVSPLQFHFYGLEGMDVREPVGELHEHWWEQIEVLEREEISLF